MAAVKSVKLRDLDEEPCHVDIELIFYWPYYIWDLIEGGWSKDYICLTCNVLVAPTLPIFIISTENCVMAGSFFCHVA